MARSRSFEFDFVRRRLLRAGNRVGFNQLFAPYRESSAGMPTVTQVGRVGGVLPEH